MVVNFADLKCLEPPLLILRNLDGEAIQTLGTAFNIEVELSYNEVSQISFSVPEYVDGIRTAHYDDIVGMRIVDLVGCGQFILVNPQEEFDGVKRIKSCQGYSLEYEFSKKNIYLEAGTYNLYDGIDTSNEDTIIGRIRERLPDWTFVVDDSLIGKYRTFDDLNKNVYDFIKSDVQEKYGCIFDFDTRNAMYNHGETERRVFVRNVNTVRGNTTPKQVYLSPDALIENVSVEEDSDSIVTCLDVNGADGIDIRGVNPTGTNKIYNLDYFMNTTNFHGDKEPMIAAWHAWEEAVDGKKSEYYGITVSYNMKLMEILLAQAELNDLQTEMTILENERATSIQYYGSGMSGIRSLSVINADIRSKQAQIDAKNAQIDVMRGEAIALDNMRRAINEELDFENFFTAYDDEHNTHVVDILPYLKRYFIEDTIEDSSFVERNAITYDAKELSTEIGSGAALTLNSKYSSTSEGGVTTYSFTGGAVSIGTLSSQMVSGTLRYNNTSSSFLFTAYLNSGDIDPNRAGTVEDWTDVAPRDMAEMKQIITDTGVWAAGSNNNVKTALIKIPDGATQVKLEPNDLNGYSFYSLLTSNSTTGTPSFATGCTGRVRYEDTTTVDIPEDAQYLWVYLHTASAGNGGNLSPKYISFYGPVQLETSSYVSGNLTISGSATRSNSDATGTALTLTISSGRLYFTENATEYERNQIEWDLLDYGYQVLYEHASPTYNFSVDSANFLALDEYLVFQNQLKLGERVYLNLGDDNILNPYVVSVHLNYDDPTSFSIEFSSGYTSFDQSFALSSLLDQSVSMGKTLSYKSNMYSAFVNSRASSNVKRFMESALDIAKNRVLSSGQQAISFDDTGLRIRQWKDDEHREYNPREIWAVNNTIVFTDDGWNTAKMAIGEIFDSNLKYVRTSDTTRDNSKTYYVKGKDGKYTEWNPSGSVQWSTNLYEIQGTGTAYGIAAPNIVGTLLAGQNLVIDTDNGAFRVDEHGVHIDSLKFYITHGSGGSDSTWADEVSGIKDSIVTTYYQNKAPTNPKDGDIWYDTGSKSQDHLFKYDSSLIPESTPWVTITDASLKEAYDRANDARTAAANAQTTADSKITTHYQATDPSAYWTTDKKKREHVGDIWYNTSNDVIYDETIDTEYYPKKAYLWNSYTQNNKELYRWKSLEDGSIKTLGGDIISINSTLLKVIQDGYLKADKLQGVINAQASQMKGASGNVLFDKDGLWLLNEPTKESATKAIWMNERGIMFGTGTATGNNDYGPGDVDDSGWTFTTAISHDGIIADAIATKTLSSFTIDGGSISIGEKVNGHAPFEVDTYGNLIATSGTFKGSISATYLYLPNDDGFTGNIASGGKIQPDYLNLKGITVTDGTNKTFEVDRDGNVTIRGKITMTGGSITWGDGTTGVAHDAYLVNAVGTANDNASSAVSTANNASGNATQAYNMALSAQGTANSAATTLSGWTYSGTTYIDGRNIVTDTVTASKLQGGQVNLLGSDGFVAGQLILTTASSYEGQKVYMRSGAIQISGTQGDVYLSSWASALQIKYNTTEIACTGNFVCSPDNGYSCGSASNRWSAVYAATGTIQTSDKNDKTAINYDLSDYEQFYNDLEPMSFKFIDGTSGRTHIGLGAQDVEASLSKAGISDTDFAGFVRARVEDDAETKADDGENENTTKANTADANSSKYKYALRYSEFVPLNIWQIQKLKKRVDALEAAFGIK